MRIPYAAVTLVIVPLLFSACGGGTEQGTEGTQASGSGSSDVTAIPDPEEDIGEVLATVGGIQIGEKEFEAAAARERPADGEALSEEEKQEVLRQLIEEKMLYLEAKKRGIDLDPKVQKVMVNTLLRKDVYAAVRNSDFSMAELEAYFEEHKDEFVVPEKVQIRRIFIKAGGTRSEEEAKALADELYAEVKANPERFKEIASEKSEDPYRRRGGDLGFLGREGKPGIEQAVIDLAFSLEEGQIAEPFLAEGGYHIVRLEKRRERVDRSFDQMKGSVLRQVKNDRYKELYAAYIEQIAPDYEVSIDEAKLAAAEGRAARRMSVDRESLPMPSRDDRSDLSGDEPSPSDTEVGEDAP